MSKVGQLIIILYLLYIVTFRIKQLFEFSGL